MRGGPGLGGKPLVLLALRKTRKLPPSRGRGRGRVGSFQDLRASVKFKLATDWFWKFTSKSNWLTWRPSKGWTGRALGKKPPACATAWYCWSCA